MPLGICTKIITQIRVVVACHCSSDVDFNADTDLHRLSAVCFNVTYIPFVAPHAKRIGKQILGNVAKTGMEVVSDVVSGKSAKESVKERALSGIKRTVGDIVSQSPFKFGQDNAAKRPRPQQSTATKKRKKKKVTVKPGRRRNDIFV